MKHSLRALPFLLLATACGGGDDAPRPVEEAAAVHGPDDGHDHDHDHDHDHGGTASTAAPREGAPPGPSPGRPLEFDRPEGWVDEPPENSMRLAQYRLPPAEGDSEPAEVLVTYFGEGGAGTVEQNVARWCGAFRQPDGSSTRDSMRMSTRRANGIAITEFDIRGTYLGMRGDEQSADHRMVVALVESDHGPYYVKLTGPEATVAKWLPSFRSFVTSGCS